MGHVLEIASVDDDPNGTAIRRIHLDGGDHAIGHDERRQTRLVWRDRSDAHHGQLRVARNPACREVVGSRAESGREDEAIRRQPLEGTGPHSHIHPGRLARRALQIHIVHRMIDMLRAVHLAHPSLKQREAMFAPTARRDEIDDLFHPTRHVVEEKAERSSVESEVAAIESVAVHGMQQKPVATDHHGDSGQVGFSEPLGQGLVQQIRAGVARVVHDHGASRATAIIARSGCSASISDPAAANTSSPSLMGRATRSAVFAPRCRRK